MEKDGYAVPGLKPGRIACHCTMAADKTDEDDEEELEWLLGFPEQPEKPEHLQRHFFPSKLGGLPAWLQPEDAPASHELDGFRFLLQVYAPHTHNAYAFHRQLVVLVRPPMGTQETQAHVLVLRCQLPRENHLYSYFPPADGDDCPPTPTAARPSAAWEKHLLQSGLVFPEYQLIVEPEYAMDDHNDGDAALSADHCNGSVTASNAATREEREIESEEDCCYVNSVDGEYKNPQNTQSIKSVQTSEARALANGYESTEEQKLLQMLEQQAEPTERSTAFAAFCERVEQNPGQILRYCFHHRAGPLWPVEGSAPAPEDVPTCEHCGSRRVFEMQVLPHTMHFLQQEESADDIPNAQHGLVDFGTIAVYSCEASCCLPHCRSGMYAHEYPVVLPPLDIYT